MLNNGRVLGKDAKFIELYANLMNILLVLSISLLNFAPSFIDDCCFLQPSIFKNNGDKGEKSGQEVQ